MLEPTAHDAMATPVWDHGAMPEDVMTRLKQAARAKRNARARADKLVSAANSGFEAAVLEALNDGRKPGEIADATEHSYETIRRIARAHGIKPLREPTVTSRKRLERN
ncbi:hypothetical protein [Streptomyces sp. ST2-7A]|uniref:hypothetical protein n=1 Tax=Streptomyces sp. ST2-7A TaxID=2907214 RepID=UPI001F2DF5C4|nr:hypothetical protein [Streptomyces sp. ST2-7A]MCE7083476.1 hypothetical protein [Streptomyces sp. ST2-7A]